MIKNFKFEIEENIKSIFISNALIMLLIIFTYSDNVSLINQYGKLRYGEWINILLNDTYTSIYGFSFVFLYLLVTWNKQRENELYIMVRYESRIKYYMEKYITNIMLSIIFVLWIVLCGIVMELFCAQVQENMSITFQQYCIIYGYPIQSYSVVKSIVLYIILTITSVNFYFFLKDRFRSISIALCIFGGGIFLLAATTLGAFGERSKILSVFTWGREFETMKWSFFTRVVVLLVLNVVISVINLIGFQRRELKYAKGSKQYQV